MKWKPTPTTSISVRAPKRGLWVGVDWRPTKKGVVGVNRWVIRIGLGLAMIVIVTPRRTRVEAVEEMRNELHAHVEGLTRQYEAAIQQVDLLRQRLHKEVQALHSRYATVTNQNKKLDQMCESLAAVKDRLTKVEHWQENPPQSFRRYTGSGKVE